jgi:hypothetical protein
MAPPPSGCVAARALIPDYAGSFTTPHAIRAPLLPAGCVL